MNASIPSLFVRAIACLAMLFAMFAANAQLVKPNDGLAAIPPLATRVTDASGALNMAEVATLDQKIRAFEAKSGGQLAVLIVPSIQPETIEQYALRVAEAWKIGKKGKDNGALIVLAMQEKKVRIETGYGYEGTLTDLESKRIIREVMSPYFKQGQFGAGLGAGLDKIMLTVTKDPANVVAAPEWNKSHQSGAKDEIGDGLLSMAPMLLGVFAVLSFMLPSLLVGIIGGVGTMMFTGSAPLAIGLGVGGFILSALLKGLFGGLRNNMGAGQRMRHVSRSGGIGPGVWFPTGGGGFGGGGGGGSMPDIFSGGGGGFGGGGASGGWGDGE